MTLDGWERDGTLHCINCGHVAWATTILQHLPDAPAYLRPKEPRLPAGRPEPVNWEVAS